ncbi:MAG: TRAP transporter small permease subunit [Gemmobacter sp.]|uniref:TRAP transporter small permease subunit n=1 Tax=Gemmobacter sp. TaxID=1898957 RepID=UPI0039198A40
MRLLDLTIAVLDGITALIGRMVSWLVLYMVLMTFVNVVLRYMYGIANIAMIETVLYAFAIVMAATGGWTLMRNEHVRIDILYGKKPPRTRAAIDLGGSLLLLAPVLWVIWNASYPYVQRSWRLKETSSDVAGLPYVYLLKSFLLVFVAVLAVQGVAFALRNLRILLTGREDAPTVPAEGTR